MPSTVDIAQSPLPPDLVDEYGGKWVAIRDGDVVAAADSLGELRENPEVQREDAVYIVPERHSYFY